MGGTAVCGGGFLEESFVVFFVCGATSFVGFFGWALGSRRGELLPEVFLVPPILVFSSLVAECSGFLSSVSSESELDREVCVFFDANRLRFEGESCIKTFTEGTLSFSLPLLSVLSLLAFLGSSPLVIALISFRSERVHCDRAVSSSSKM